MRPERHEIGTPIHSARMTGRVTLREVTDADLPIFFAHQRDPEAGRMANFPARDRDAFMAHWAKIVRDGSVVVRTVELGDAVAGNVVSWVHDEERDVGHRIGREHWGQGVATAALASFLTLFEERPLSAHVAEHNVGSIRVLEKCGFVAVDRVGIAGEPVTELLFPARGVLGDQRLRPDRSVRAEDSLRHRRLDVVAVKDVIPAEQPGASAQVRHRLRTTKGRSKRGSVLHRGDCRVSGSTEAKTMRSVPTSAHS